MARFNYGPSKAVDTSIATWFCSNFDVGHSWWRLDLGDGRYIHKIDILPRSHPTDAFAFRDVEIRVGTTDLSSGDFTSWTLYAHYMGPYTVQGGRLLFTSYEGIPGRYISVQRGMNVTEAALKILDFKVYVRIH
ncbi:uncharacterized protein LOC135215860 [Macrobrachium nipponense]|uniref:uncharacterized protein LOC135215860 n=1 Tax=Macrobrachium nipponense TaxID=159736 RepID=UPI0030C7B812